MSFFFPQDLVDCRPAGANNSSSVFFFERSRPFEEEATRSSAHARVAAVKVATKKAPRRRTTAAARRYGKLGGRPRSRLPADVVARLGDVPEDVFDRARWAHRAL